MCVCLCRGGLDNEIPDMHTRRGGQSDSRGGISLSGLHNGRPKMRQTHKRAECDGPSWWPADVPGDDGLAQAPSKASFSIVLNI